MGKWLRDSPQTLAVLAALLERPAGWHYGYAISRQTELASGTLYPILMRLERLGWLETRWETPGGGRPPRHLYRLTGAGRERAREERREARAERAWHPARSEA